MFSLLVFYVFTIMHDVVCKKTFSLPDKKVVKKIGILDSGVGGLVVLRPLLHAFPAQYLYVADVAFFPYGDKSLSFVAQRVTAIIDFLLQEQVDLVIIACNTACAALYFQQSNKVAVPVICISDFMVANAINRPIHSIGIMATQATIESGIYQQKLQQYNPQMTIIEQACIGLADAIEHGNQTTMDALLQKYTHNFLQHHIDALLVACTHYEIVEKKIQELVGSMPIICMCRQVHAIADCLIPLLEQSNCTLLRTEQCTKKNDMFFELVCFDDMQYIAI